MNEANKSRKWIFSSLRKRNFIFQTVIVSAFLFIRGVVWLATTPLWQAPDEPAHFARVQALAENGQVWPKSTELHLSKEVKVSVDKLEIDKFPWDTSPSFGRYKLSYPPGMDGSYESEIRQIPVQYRSEMVATASAWAHSPGYYLPAALIYRLFRGGDLFLRVTMVRAFSLLLSLGTVFFAYRIGQLIFMKNIGAIFASLIVALEPMFSFVSVTINNDSLAIFLATASIYYLLYSLQKKKWVISVAAFVLAIIATFVKANMAFLLPLCLIAFLTLIPVRRKFLFGIVAAGILSGLLLVFGSYASQHNYYLQVATFYQNLILRGKVLSSFQGYFRLAWPYWRLRVLPTFWGVFGWEDTNMPLWIYGAMNKTLLVSFFGWILFFGRKTKKSNVNLRLISWCWFILICNLVVAVLFDWWNLNAVGKLFGLQGRYFFGSIVPFVVVWTYGIINVFPARWHFKVLCVIFLLMVGLNTAGIAAIVQRFYSANSFNVLLEQMSQYKPVFFKGFWLIFLVVLYFLLMSAKLIYLGKKYIFRGADRTNK